MAKQLNVNLSFTADTDKVKMQIKELQNALTKITQNASKASPLGLTEDVNSAIKKVTELQGALQRATTSSGKLDLGQFHQELNKANLDAKQIATALAELGPEGQAAFAKIAQSVSMAELPIKRTNNLLNEFATTLKNTARWQLSSSILHGFVGSVQSAYRYAQDLNKSLNDIRIVTGQSAEQMADFAKQANESAKALSATTTAYTDASLIFYQQGLSDDAVKERTDAVIKMSNVTGEAVKDVSSYMTAIWNNFDDGSQSLEHYADVITALGAATASSSEEIAGGLEKFASIGKTVGLSYDYATAALATVVSATRQSEDVVGNAFKTIFSRIQGLKLGETLEDDVDLNKYSAALKAVGVEVIDATGELKNLDTILDDLASKWDLLTTAQQTALAQTVAGTRQYAQFIALMSNWDSMTRNLEVARNSEGALQEQADIYAESWEAARKRVKASAQAIYDDLLNDEFFIDLNNGVSKVLDSVHEVIESIGGLRGIIPIVSSLLLKMFGGDVINSLNNFKYNIQLMSESGRQAIINRRKEFNQALAEMKINMEDAAGLGTLYQKQGDAQNKLIEKTIELNRLNKDLTEEEKLNLKLLQDQADALIAQYNQKSQILEQSQKQAQMSQIKAATIDYSIFKGAKGNQSYSNQESYQNSLNIASKNTQSITILENSIKRVNEAFKNGLDISNISKSIQSLKEQLEMLGFDFENIPDDIAEVYDELFKLGEKSEFSSKDIEDLNKSLNNLSNKSGHSFITIDTLIKKIDITSKEGREAVQALEAYKQKIREVGEDSVKVGLAFSSAEQGINNINEASEQAKGTIVDLGETVVSLGQGVSSFAMYLNSINSLIDSFTDPDVDGWERFIRVLTSAGMLIPSLVTASKSLKTVMEGLSAISFKTAAAVDAENIANKIKENQQLKNNLVTETNITIEEFQNKTLKEKINILKGLSKEQMMHIGLTEAEATVMTTATTASEAFKTSLASNPYGWILLAIGAVVAITSTLISVEKKRKEETIEANNAEIERLNKIQDEINANQELIKQYNELFDAYKNGQKSKEDLYDITDQLVEKYNLEGAALAKLTGNYDAFADSLNNIQRENLNKNIQNSELIIQRIKSNQSTLGYDTFGTKTSKNEADIEFVKRMLKQKKSSRLIDLTTPDLVVPEGVRWTGSESGDIELIVESYEDALNLLEEIRKLDNKTQKEMSLDEGLLRYINNHQEEVEAYKEVLRELEEYETQLEVLNINPEEVNSLDDYDKALEDVTQALVEQRVEQERATELAKTYLAQRSSEFKGYQEQKQLISDLATEWNNLGEAELRNIVTSEKFSEEQLRMMVNLNINPSEEEDIQQYLDNVNARLKIEHFDINSEALNAALDDLTKDKKVSDDVMASLQDSFPDFDWESFGTETYINQIEIINDLLDQQNKLLYEGHKEQEETSPELAEQREEDIKNLQRRIELKEKELETLQKYTGEDSISTEQAKKELTELQQELTKLLNGDSFDFTADYLDVIEKTYENHVNSIISMAEAAKSAAELIGEGFKVAAEDAQALYDVYPELYDQAEVLANGDIQLNQQVVETVLNGNSEVIKSNRQVAIDELEQKIELTEAQMNYYKLQMDAIDKYLDGESTKADLEQELEANTAAFEEDLSKTLTENQILDMKAAAKANTELADITCDNIEIMAQYAAEFGKVLNAALAGDSYTASFNKDGLGGNVTDYTSSDHKAIDEVTRRDGEEAVKQALEEFERYQNLYEGASKEDAYYKNLLSKLNAKNTELDNAFGGVGRSKGTNSKQDLKDLKKYLDEFDRFYPIKKAIEDVSDALNDLSKQQQHLTGKNLINSLTEQNELLEDQASLYKNLLSEQEQYRNELAETLGSFGMTFDAATGNITNYTAATQSALDKYNQAIIAYNASAQDEVAKATLKTAEDEYNVFKNTLSKYQSILKDIEDTANNLDDIVYKQIENNFKAFEVEIKLDLDIEEAKRKVNDFLKDINTDFKKIYKTTKEWTDLFKVAAKNVTSFTETNGTIETDLKALKEVADIIDNADYDYLSSNSMFADRTEAIEKYRALAEQVMSDAKELYNLYNSTWDNYLSAIDEAKDQWDSILSGFDKVDKTLNHYKKLIELLYSDSDSSKDYLDQIYSATANNSLAKQESLRQEIDALRNEYNEILALGGDTAEEDINKLVEAIEKAEDDLASEIETYISTIQDQLFNAIDSIMSTADKALTQGIGGAKVSERWNDSKEAAKGYYDEVQKIYQLESLQTKWEKLINDSNNLKYQKYLTELMNSQLDNLKNKTKLSEYDIELAEKQLAIYQAQIALEDSQNNKNSMKLVRNQQGNWTYQYVADQDDVADKQQNLLDTLYDRYNFVKTSSEEATEAVLNLYQTAQEKLSNLMKEYKTADTKRRAEIEKEYNYLYDYYYGPDGLIIQKSAETATMQDDLNKAVMESLWGLYKVDENNFDLMTSKEKELLNDLREYGISSFEDLTLKVAGDNGFYQQIEDKCKEVNDENKTSWQELADNIINSWSEDPNSVRNTINNVYNDILAKVAEYDGAIKRSEEASNLSWSNIKINIDQVIQSTQTVIDKTQELSNYRVAINEISNAWGNVQKSIAGNISQLDSYVAKLKEASGAKMPSYSTNVAPTGGYTTSAGAVAGASTGASTLSGNSSNTNKAHPLSPDNDPSKFGPKYMAHYMGTTRSFNTKAEAEEFIKMIGNPASAYIEQYASGGYTGDWGSDGKLAVLHEKELVLNKEDTSNILNAVNIVRKLGALVTGSIDNGLAGMAMSLTGLIPAIANNNHANNINDNNNTFNITAEFPNAANVEEIREAILTLPNLASQYLNKK